MVSAGRLNCDDQTRFADLPGWKKRTKTMQVSNAAAETTSTLPWQILIVDDDESVHQTTRFALDDLLDEVCGKEVDGVAVTADTVKGQLIEADRDQLYRAFSNLIRNAVQAGAQAIEVSARRGDGATVVDISDDGPGLPPRAQENLFKPFKGSTRAGGTGLGLAIARELLRGHGGDLELHQTSGSGTTFRLIIPDRAAV